MKRNNKQSNRRPRREQPRKDSKDKRVNYDNTRESKFERDVDKGKDVVGDKSNDVRWYANNPELLRAAASIPFSPTLGSKLPGTTNNSVPGVMALYWSPAINPDANAPLNQAANSVYSFTVHANSRNKSYDPADEMLLILAGAQVFAGLALGIRAYGTMRQYSQLNRYTPQALITAMGFDFTDLQNNYSQMWFDLNEMIARTQQIWIPNTMPVIERWFWLNSNIYMDAASAKAQYYVFVPYQLYQYDETSLTTGGSLQPVTWMPAIGSTGNTWSDYMSKMNGMINALVNSQDRGIIMGDILKAYGADKLYALSSLSVDYTTIPVYNAEVLTQIENCSVFASVPKAITQDSNKNGLLSQEWTAWPEAKLTGGGSVGMPDNFVLNFHQMGVPTPEQVMVATRLRSMGGKITKITKVGSNSTYQLSPATCGTEVILGIQVAMVQYTNNATGTVNMLNLSLQQVAGTTNWSSTELAMWSAFDWAPWLYTCTYPEVKAGQLVLGFEYYNEVGDMLGDWDMYTFLTKEELKKMNSTAIYSEFGVPVIFG